MPARLLAYGGTSFSERRRIGQWPPVPEATLRDGYGLQANSWSYGFGVLEKQPFLIFRQRQNVKNRGGYPFSLLLDPGEAVWERFEWNAAAIVAALIDISPEVLFRNPETCSADALDRLLGGLEPGTAGAKANGLSYLVAESTRELEPIVTAAPRPEPLEFSAALAALPVCFRAGAGWIAGGGAAHGRALGANLVVDPQSKVDAEAQAHAGKQLLEAWQRLRKRATVQTHERTPAWLWDEKPLEFLEAIMLLYELETAAVVTDDLLARAENASALQPEIEQEAAGLLTRGSAPLGPRASALLLGLVLKGKRKIDARVAERLDPETVLAELRRNGSPPKRVPRALPISRDLKTGIWIDYLERLQSDVRKNLAEALEQLGPDLDRQEREALVHSALIALPASEERLLDWNKFRQDEETWALLQAALREETLRRFRRNAKGAAEAYLLLADDPGGALASEALTQDDEVVRLVADIRSLQKDYPEEAGAWLEALKKSPLRDRLPKPKLEPPRRQPRAREEIPELRETLRTLLFETDADSVDARAKELRKYDDVNTAEIRPGLDSMIHESCEQAGERFANSFAGKYLALGQAMRFLTLASQDRLVECMASNLPNFAALAARDVSHALNNPASRNAYTRALSRALVQDRRLSKAVAMQLGELPVELEGKLKRRLLTKDTHA